MKHTLMHLAAQAAILKEATIPAEPVEHSAIKQPTPAEILQRQTFDRVMRQHDGIVLALVRERLRELPYIELRQLAGRVEAREFLPTIEREGYLEWSLDGQPLVRFFAPKVSVTTGAQQVMHVDQRYEVIG